MTPLYTFQRAELERIAKLNDHLKTVAQKRAHNERMKAEGLVQVHGWVHPHQLNDLAVLIHKLRADPKLMVGPVRHEMTGKLHKLR
ncbi:hypothetical protein [Mesorhizobium sp. ANAO-SY3R2]|uniref:hypothetical protein n=1 Tax=Mesorhizobium sp. ANAO-SY3R2 TaxID=3166644 RepID=UPI00366E30A7